MADLSTVDAGARLESELDEFLGDPVNYFGRSFAAMHTVPREKLIEMHRAGISRRFEQQRERIPMVAKLADGQGITAVEEIADVVPLMFEHTMYKSYPVALLERSRFDLMTDWISKLTALDLAGADMTDCDSIDAWLWRLADVGLEPSFSSGTSGTMSFFPWSFADLMKKFWCQRVAYLQVVQPFPTPPTPSRLEERWHYLHTAMRTRRNYLGDDVFALGEKGYSHIRNPNGHSADIGWLAARLRFAQISGDVSRVRVPENLLARIDELDALNARAPEIEREWAGILERLQGERIISMAFTYDLYEFAAPRLAKGERWTYHPESALLLGGGTKGRALPEDWESIVRNFFDLPIHGCYGMMELSCMSLECSEGRYHLPPWTVPYVLDPDTSAMLPRQGVQRGRAAFFDLLPDDSWGGFITGDEIEVDFDTPCGCGATTLHMSSDISRLSDLRGGNDKINCAGTPQAHAEAMAFLLENR